MLTALFLLAGAPCSYLAYGSDDGIYCAFPNVIARVTVGHPGRCCESCATEK